MATATDTMLDNVEQLKLVLQAAACGGGMDDEAYRSLRRELLSSDVADQLPRFVRNCRSIGEFWEHIKATDTSRPNLGIWAGRRLFLQEQFQALILKLESATLAPQAAWDSPSLDTWNSERVGALWMKAKSRCDSDPEGAITVARSLLESVLKHILAEANEDVENEELPRLYKQVARRLNLAPDQHAEQLFKMILSGCVSVVNGLASVRNGLSDAHGTGPASARPSARHARLVVSLAGAMSNFLIETWQNIQASNSHEAGVA